MFENSKTGSRLKMVCRIFTTGSVRFTHWWAKWSERSN